MDAALLNAPVKKDRHSSPTLLFKKLSQRAHLLTELLPYDPSIKTGSRLLDGLKELLLLFKAFELTIDALKRNELKNFDPLVGENACQIRAVKLAIILSNCSFDWTPLNQQIHQRKQVIEKLLLDRPLVQSGLSLRDVINRDNLDIQVTQIELFLIKSYLLTKVKVTKPFKSENPLLRNEYTDTKKIKEISNVGSTFADNFVKNLREKLAFASVKFVKTIATEISNQDQLELSLDELCITHNGLQQLPCYWLTRILLKYAELYSIPIAMLIDQKATDRFYEVIEKTILFFHCSSDGYIFSTGEKLDQNQPALAIYGTTYRKFDDFPEQTQWIEELLEYSPVDLFLVNTAAHRQYPDESKESLLYQIEDSIYIQDKIKAENWGCSVQNPSRFFISHVFCDTIENIRLSF